MVWSSMSQLSFDWKDPEKRSTRNEEYRHRLFFGFRPSAEAVSESIEIAQSRQAAHSLTGRLRPSELLHLTLNGIGAYRRLPDDVIFGAAQVAATVRARSFELTLDQTMSFKHQYEPQASVLSSSWENEALMYLYKQLREGMYEAGLPYDRSGHLTPHMTLLYDRKTVPAERLNRPVRWKVREFLLIHSEYGSSKHQLIGRWPLLD
ncbi:2'-5' RNA ligase [Rhizobium laguerreae]|uniref:2'-5' RNA ligase family protein n=1 Tax=Rhizobium laguerreae TaxID=1076926 RepID=UPI001C922B22|nr:2'-5' RNA ligase family protein [Rhizobium laguerreae]MBY3072544.1 2'-5' RNA ligase [Rhizobium laguerreae]